MIKTRREAGIAFAQHRVVLHYDQKSQLLFTYVATANGEHVCTPPIFSDAFDLESARRYATAKPFRYMINYEAQACAMNNNGSSIPFLIYPVSNRRVH